MKRVGLAVAFLLLLASLQAAAQSTTADTVEGYLKQLHVKYQKGANGEFQFTLGFPDARTEKFIVRALPEVKVIYIAIVDIAQLPTDPTRQAAVYRTVSELNYKLLVGKVEVEPETRSVRLSFTFANENGVDFPSFQAVIQSLLTAVEKVREALRSI